MLTLAEEFLLLAYDDHKGTPRVPQYGLPYGLAGAVLMELALRGIVRQEDNKLYLTAAEKIEADAEFGPLASYVKEKSDQLGRPKSLKYWVLGLGKQVKRTAYRPYLLERLKTKGLLTSRKEKYFIFFTMTVYPSIDVGAKEEIRKRVREAVLDTYTPVDERTTMLISLLKACRADRHLFSQAEYKTVKQRMTQVMKEEPYGHAISKAILELQASTQVYE
ncbi:GOLPH3/VPS74 family protein [Marinicrinis sediminis]|uniref:GPP34 family phosphoprotein n=1 Tax=Marinicrinis sediminis TaxID=1652465 RepID=A0ABW5RC29_9BACL